MNYDKDSRPNGVDTITGEVLAEAMPWIKNITGKTIVIKYGGSAMVDEQLRAEVMADIVLLKIIGVNPVIVHGGGLAISEAMKRFDMPVKFIDGQRVTTDAAMKVVRSVLEVSDVDIACVAGCFPSSQSYIEVKVAETALAVEGGADEIDIVLNLGNFLDGDYEEVCDEISELKHSCRDARLKVILETGALKTDENIKAASVLAMYSGADFIKTSTGKEYPGASLEAAYVMCQCIKEYYDKTGRMVGFKPAGGVRSAKDAASYYTIVKEVLGEKWLTNEYFRIGASGLANNLLTEIWGTETKYF